MPGNSANARYQVQATSLFLGSGVVSAAADSKAGQGVFIAVGSRLYRVAPTGDIVMLGAVQDAYSLASIVPTGVVLRCGSPAAAATQGVWSRGNACVFVCLHRDLESVASATRAFGTWDKCQAQCWGTALWHYGSDLE